MQEDLRTTLGFIGFGEAAFNLAMGLGEAGFGRMHAFDVVFQDKGAGAHRSIGLKRVEQSGVTLCSTPAELAASARTLVLAVPAQHADSAARGVLAHLTAAHLLVDVTSSAPSLKKELGRQCARNGVEYADSPMLGPLTTNRHKVPIIACGPGARQWQRQMAPWGMNIRVIDGAPGQATRIKLARSIFTKGFEALLVETFMFARKCGVADILMESIEGTMDQASFRKSATRYMGSDLVHAKRKAHEMKEVVNIMRSTGLTPMVGQGALSRLEFVAGLGSSDALGGIVPTSLDEIYETWEKCGAV